ncbi:MAG: hypothetical protein VB125_00015 [Burkholderia sp.]
MRLRNASSVATLVERTSLFVTLGKKWRTRREKLRTRRMMPTRRATDDAVGHLVKYKPEPHRCPAPALHDYDQGREMAKHEQIPEATGIKVYFADPHSLVVART